MTTVPHCSECQDLLVPVFIQGPTPAPSTRGCRTCRRSWHLDGPTAFDYRGSATIGCLTWLGAPTRSLAWPSSRMCHDAEQGPVRATARQLRAWVAERGHFTATRVVEVRFPVRESLNR